jgi:acyl transferase domain-containing protein/acyl carrier protein
MTVEGARANDVAVIGMSGRFPGARTVEEFWDNLREGRETIGRFTRDDIQGAGVDPQALGHPGYVNAGGVLDGIDLFDAGFFGFNAREAEITDPQQRLFLECAWEALEDAGYDPARFEGMIGVYGGVAMSRYVFNLYSRPELMATVGPLQVLLATDKDHLTTRTAYKLNLSGPAVTVQTACSTSLVAVSLAYQSLLDYQCDMALAGGVTIIVPQKTGYLYQPGGINSPDGHCRAFDAKAMGTVGGNGVGVVLLKRVEDALADGDAIYAVIKGAAINNDGAVKVGYTAPSIHGQARVIAMAQAVAEVEPDTIGYIEAHGTGTPLGDPIEIAALTQVFRGTTRRPGYCALGSVKTNVGHLDCAAGVAGLIKTVLALKHRELPPSLHFEQANPKLELANSPFYVNTTRRPWPPAGSPRRAGVSSFGIGGTNAHVVLEEAPAPPIAASSRRHAVLTLSARSAEALDAMTMRLSQHLARHAPDCLADVAYTCALGRRAFPYRRAVVARTLEEAQRLLDVRERPGAGPQAARAEGKLVFLFPGQGAQYAGMGRDLLAAEPQFREHFERCADAFRPHLGMDLARVIGATNDAGQGGTTGDLDRTELTQPALFAVEYALAKVLEAWGIRPHAMVGHSIGEYVAACLAGVFTFEDTVMLVAARGRLMQRMRPGGMVALSISESDAGRYLGDGLELASVNGPLQCVVSGPCDAIVALEARLASEGVPGRRLRTSHAFHSALMSAASDEFETVAAQVRRAPPRIPFISNVSGDWIAPDQATSAAYWAAQLRRTVRFGDALERLLAMPEWSLVEVGPGVTLGTLARQHPQRRAEQHVVATMRHARDNRYDEAALIAAVGELWCGGVEVDWAAFYAHEQRRRVHLPTYPFQRQRYWIDARPAPGISAATEAASPAKRDDIGAWFYRPVWRSREAVPATPSHPGAANWLLLSDAVIGPALARRLEGAGSQVTQVTPRTGERLDGARACVVPDATDEYTGLLDALEREGRLPDRIVHLWTADADASLERGFFSLLALARALARRPTWPLQLLVVSSGLHAVTGGERLAPEKATILGPVRVIPQEMPHIRCRSLDLDVTALQMDVARSVDAIMSEAADGSDDTIVACRDGERRVHAIEPIAPNADPVDRPVLRHHGVYLITGGLGGMGLALARHLARDAAARIVLVARTPLPDRGEWQAWCAEHEAADRTRRSIESIRAVEALGGEVMVARADVADSGQMAAVIDRIHERFGEIHGVIHAAGVAGGGMMQLKTHDVAAQVLAPKVQGTLVLERVLQDDDLDFVVLCSSLASVLGGFGQVDYCAANAFLDAYAHAAQSRLRARRVVCINWDTWREAGMAVDTVVPRELAESRAEHLRLGIANEEGAGVLVRAIAGSDAQVLVSTREWQARLAAGVRPAPIVATTPAASFGARHERPALDTPYCAPTGDTETFIAGVWEEMLGVAPIGTADDFFALGGHSLLAIQVVTRLRERFGVEVPVQALFDAPTVAQLARHLESASAGEGAAEQERLAETLRYVGQLSDEEVRRLLDAQAREHRA